MLLLILMRRFLCNK